MDALIFVIIHPSAMVGWLIFLRQNLIGFDMVR